MLIIPYGPEHLETLRQLFLASRQQTFSWLDTRAYKLTDFDQQTAGEFIFVALIDNQVVGFMSLWEEDSFIHHLYIAEGYQNQKIGTTLLNSAYQHLGGTARLKCLTENIRARAFYRKNGFEEREIGTSADGAYVLMERLAKQ